MVKANDRIMLKVTEIPIGKTSPLTQGLNYHSACDAYTSLFYIYIFIKFAHLLNI